MPRTVTLSLPWPPTANKYYRRVGPKTLLSREGREYRDQVEVVCRKLCGFGNARLAVDIVAQPPDRRRRDLDNLLKAVLDALQHAGLYSDDSQIDRIHLCRAACCERGSGELSVIVSEVDLQPQA